MGFWDALNQAPSSSAALPSGGAGSSKFWLDPSTSTSQTLPEGPNQTEVPDSPGNPVSYLGGTLLHVVTGIPELLKGLWTIGKSTTFDVLAGIGQATPGTFWGEENVREHGYAWANIVRRAPELIQNDYASRYGFHGLEEVKDQVYSNPLSYILDALMVSGAAATGARVGGKLGLLSEEAVSAVRGVSPLTAAVSKGTDATRPATEAMGLLGKLPQNTPVETFASTIRGTAQEGLTAISTNVSPLKRIIQQTVINKVLSRTADSAQGLIESGQWNRLGVAPDNLALQAQATERVALAAQKGLAVLKPFPEKFVASRAARYISGLSKQNFYGSRNAMIQSLHDILGVETKADFKLVQDTMGTNEWFQKYLHGEVIDPGLPSSLPKDFEAGRTDIMNFTDMDVPQVTAGDTAARRVVAESVQNFFGNTPGDNTATTSFTTPWAVGRNPAKNSDVMRYTGLVGDIKDAPNAAREFAARNGYQLIGVRNAIADGTSAWNGLHYFMRDAEGRIFELNIADQNLYNAQKLVSRINDHVRKWTGVDMSFEEESASIMRELAGDIEMGLAAEDAAAMARLEQVGKLSANIKEELEAATLWAQRIWDHPMRHFNGGYANAGENAEKVDRLFNWSTEWNLLPGMVDQWHPDWAKGVLQADGTLKPLKGPFTTAMNRAFMPQKLETLHQIADWSQGHVAQMIRDGEAAGDTTDDIVDDIADFFISTQHLPRDAVRDALMVPSDKDVARAIFGSSQSGAGVTGVAARTRIKEIAQDLEEGLTPDTTFRARKLPYEPDEAAETIIKRLIESTRMPILKGEIDGALLDAWSWKNFAESVPQLPGYYPHIRMGSNSGLWWKGSAMKAPQMAFNKGFKGYLQESGRIQDDVFKAYSFRAYQILRHQELMDQFERLRPMARLMDEKELMLIQSGARRLDGEVLFSPDFAKRQLELHSRLLDDIHDGVMDGALYEDAARNAIQGINDELQSMTTEALANAKVYALPQHVADQFKSGFLQGFSPARMRMFWDKPRDAWISSVLGLNPRWFIYRAMGNIVFTGVSHPTDIPRLFGWARPKNNDLIEMILQDAKMPDGTSVLDAISRGYAAGEMQKLGFISGATKPGRLGAQSIGPRLRLWGSAADEFPRLTKALDRVYESRVARLPRGISNFSTRWVNHMEQAERRGIALGTLARQTGTRLERSINIARKAADEGFDPVVVDQMMSEANWVLGNYTNLSPLERDVVRRFFMPFYPFYRHMLKFGARMPWDHPAKAAVLGYLWKVDEDMGPHLPDYMGGAVPIGKIGGIPAYWNITHWNPVSELSLPESSPMTFIDPRIKIAINAMTGTDEFMRPYHADNVYTAPNGVEMIRTSSGWQRFEGIQHEPWLDMFMSLYGGPGATAINPHGYNMPWQKAVAGQLGVSISIYNDLQNTLRDLEAQQAAWASTSAREVPISYGA